MGGRNDSNRVGDHRCTSPLSQASFHPSANSHIRPVLPVPRVAFGHSRKTHSEFIEDSNR